MPELAEVEFYRKQWNEGLNKKITALHINGGKRIFRGIDLDLFKKTLQGGVFSDSSAHGKQMLFRFNRNAWLGLHLGMTGKLRAEPVPFTPTKHDHLVLFQREKALVFSDPRLFGRIQFHVGKEEPDWWSNLPPQLTEPEFTFPHFQTFVQRHKTAPIKAVLLQQESFPGIGNWMADDILWQAKVNPRLSAKNIGPGDFKSLYRKIRSVAQQSLQTIGRDFSDPPASWLFRYRWKKKGLCPRCKMTLRHATIGGRTTCWCPECQSS